MILLRRWRKFIIDHASERIKGVDDTRLFELIREFCKKKGIPATDQDIQDMVSEALRRRIIEKFKEIIQTINDIDRRVTAIEAERQQIIDKFAQIDSRLDQAQTAFINLRDKVNTYHP